MKKFFKKLGFHKMDEMEQQIAFKAQRNAFIFLLVALLCWTMYESYKVYVYHSDLNPYPCFLLAAASVIQSVSQLVLTHKAVKDEEPATFSKVIKIVLPILITFAIIASIGSAIIILR